MKTMSAEMIKGTMVAEEALAREDSKGLDEAMEALPDGHPLKEEARSARAALGDLAGLPPGHPLIQAMEEARLRYEAEQGFEMDQGEGPEEDPVQVRRAKRLDSARVRQTERIREEESILQVRAAAKLWNASVNELCDGVIRLRQNAVATKEDLVGNMYAKMKVERLERMLVAVERALVESRLNEGRLTNG